MYTNEAWNEDLVNYPSKLLVTLSYQPVSHIVDPHMVAVSII